MKRIFVRKENKSDEVLLKLYFNYKDEQALAILYNRYIEAIFATCRHLIHHLQDAEDAAMEVLEVITKELNKKPKINKFKDWVFIVTRNYCFKKLKKNTKVLQLFEEIDEKNEHLFVQNPEEMTLYNEMECLYEKMDESLQTLRPIQQKCIDMFYMKGKDYKTIAKELDLTVGNVRSNIQNGRRNLRKKLRDDNT